MINECRGVTSIEAEGLFPRCYFGTWNVKLCTLACTYHYSGASIINCVDADFTGYLWPPSHIKKLQELLVLSQNSKQ